MQKVWSRHVLVALAAALATGCADVPRIAVIGLAGVRSDSLYLESIADSLMAGPNPVRVEIFDGGQSDDAYRSALRKAQAVVRTPGLVAVVGHRDSRSTLMVGPVYQEAGVPLVVPNATSRAIEDLGPLVFMMAPDDGTEGAWLARVATKRLGARRVTIFHLSDEFGIDLDEGIRAALDSDGTTVLDDVEYGLTRWRCPGDFEPLVQASLLRGVPDAVILGSRTPDAGCIVRLYGERAPSVRFLAGDGVDTGDSLTSRAGAAAGRLWVAHFWSPEEDSASTAFARRFEHATGQPPEQGAALRWDGVRLLAEAAKEVGPNRRRVAAYLRGLGRERPPYHGITGDVSFGPGASHPLILVDAWGRPVPPEAR